MAVVTFSRQLGSGGDRIAIRVCKQLGYRYFDKEMMIDAAAHVGLSEAEVVDFSEDTYKVQDFISRVLGGRPRRIKDVLVREERHGPVESLTARELNEEDCVTLIRYTIERAYNEDNTVIAGRGGQAILRDRPGTLHVRVFAPLEVRIQNVRSMGLTGVSEIKATLNERDRSSAEYLKRFYGIQWDDPELYHLLLNTGLLDIDAAVETVIAAVRKLEPVAV